MDKPAGGGESAGVTTPLRPLQRLRLAPRGVVHVGANDGREADEYLAQGAAPAVFVEPLDEPFAKLAARVAGRPGYHAVQALCSDTDGAEAVLNVASNNGESSSILAPAEHRRLHRSVEFTDARTMRTVTLDTLLADLRANEPAVAGIDTLALDVQGAELLVLKGATRTLRQIDFLYTEVAHVALYTGNARFHDVIGFLRAFDLHLFWCQLNHKFYGDALFVRPGRLDARFGAEADGQAA